MASFDAFLRTWLSQLQPQPVVDLFTVTSRAVQRTAACDGNLALIREERSRVRELLSTAARAGKLNEQGAQLADFVEGEGAMSATELDALDEQDEDDEA